MHEGAPARKTFANMPPATRVIISEAVTRISSRPWSRGCNAREALDSIYKLISLSRQQLPMLYNQETWLVVVAWINQCCPFLAKWHHRVKANDYLRPQGLRSEDEGEESSEFLNDLKSLQKDTTWMIAAILNDYGFSDSDISGLLPLYRRLRTEE